MCALARSAHLPYLTRRERPRESARAAWREALISFHAHPTHPRLVGPPGRLHRPPVDARRRDGRRAGARHPDAGRAARRCRRTRSCTAGSSRPWRRAARWRRWRWRWPSAGARTAGLPAGATETEVREALRWNEQRLALGRLRPGRDGGGRGRRAGAGRQPAARPQMREAMADAPARLPAARPRPEGAAAGHTQGHCDLLPESQISPMTRIQIARDIRMAQTLAAGGVPGKTVVLLAGSGHVDRELGVPQHLPAGLTVKAVLLRAGPAATGWTAAHEAEQQPAFDVVWTTPAVPEKDHCAELARTRAQAVLSAQPLADGSGVLPDRVGQHVDHACRCATFPRCRAARSPCCRRPGAPARRCGSSP